MAVAFRASSVASLNQTGGSTLAPAKPAGLTVDDLLVGICTSFGGTNAWTAPDGWTLLHSTTGSPGCFVFYKYADAGDVAETTFTFGLDNGYTDSSVLLAAYSGFNPNNAPYLHSVTGYATTVATYTTGGVSIAAGDDIVLGYYRSNSQATDLSAAVMSLAADNPTWSADVAGLVGNSCGSHRLQSAEYGLAQATGNLSATLGAAWPGFIVLLAVAVRTSVALVNENVMTAGVFPYVACALENSNVMTVGVPLYVEIACDVENSNVLDAEVFLYEGVTIACDMENVNEMEVDPALRDSTSTTGCALQNGNRMRVRPLLAGTVLPETDTLGWTADDFTPSPLWSLTVSIGGQVIPSARITSFGIDLDDHCGYESCSISFATSRSRKWPLRSPIVVAYDGINLFEGRLRGPQRRSIGTTLGWSLQFVGMLNQLRDHRAFRQIFADSDLDSWRSDQGPQTESHVLEVGAD